MLDRLSPLALAAIGIALLSAMDVIVKHLSGSNGTLTLTFGRFFSGAVAAVALWWGMGAPRITWGTVRAHALRAIIILATAGGFFLGIAKLPLVEVITLGFTAPLLIPFASWLVNGERPRGDSLAACALGFVGALIAISGAPPEQANPEDRAIGVASILFSATCYALSVALLRRRAEEDGTPIIGLMQTVLPCLFVAPFALTLAPLPSAVDWPLFALLGLVGTGAWYMLIKAYARAEAQAIAPLEYTALIWAAIYGVTLFQEELRPQVLVGAVLIIVASLGPSWLRRPRKIIASE